MSAVFTAPAVTAPATPCLCGKPGASAFTTLPGSDIVVCLRGTTKKYHGVTACAKARIGVHKMAHAISFGDIDAADLVLAA